MCSYMLYMSLHDRFGLLIQPPLPFFFCKYNVFWSSSATSSCFLWNCFFFQIVGTSKKFRKKKMLGDPDISDGEESMNSLSNGSARHRIQSFTPSTPPPTAMNYRTAKRRKGIPHRSPMGGGLIIQYWSSYSDFGSQYQSISIYIHQNSRYSSCWWWWCYCKTQKNLVCNSPKSQHLSPVHWGRCC